MRSSQTPSLGSKGLEMTLPPHSVSVLTLPVLVLTLAAAVDEALQA